MRRVANQTKTEAVVWTRFGMNSAFLFHPEPFMSLLLVLTHMEFKLDMEVRLK